MLSESPSSNGSAGPSESPSPSESAAPGESPGPAQSTSTGESAPPASPASLPAGEPLPECAYKDLPATGDPDKDWSTMVLDTIYRLPADFAPRKLVSTSKAGMQAGYEVIPAVVDDLRAMHEASAAARAEIAVRWAYRSYGEQQGAFAYWVRQSGRQAALHRSARPGHSEHQLGTAIDFRSADSLKAPWDYPDWADTPAGAWMLDNAWRHGFVLSYPKGKEDFTCYGYESWHYRYVGRDFAQRIHDSGLTPREFLWDLAHASH
jgi:D-alanyl-D-alanine carboxypeptidase